MAWQSGLCEPTVSVVGAGNALHVCSEHLFDTGHVTSIESPIQCQCELSASVGQARLLRLCPSNGVAMGSVWTYSERGWHGERTARVQRTPVVTLII